MPHTGLNIFPVIADFLSYWKNTKYFWKEKVTGANCAHKIINNDKKNCHFLGTWELPPVHISFYLHLHGYISFVDPWQSPSSLFSWSKIGNFQLFPGVTYFSTSFCQIQSSKKTAQLRGRRKLFQDFNNSLFTPVLSCWIERSLACRPVLFPSLNK